MYSEEKNGTELANTSENTQILGQSAVGMDLNLPIQVSYATCLDRLISDNEDSMKIDLPDEVKDALKVGFFTPASFLGQLKNCFNDSVYAAIFIDEKEGRTIKFCQQYEDGSFSALFTIPQETLLTLTVGKQYPEFARDAQKCLKAIIKEYFRKTTGKEMLPIKEVLEVLIQHLPELPTVNTNVRMEPAKLYADVMAILKAWSSGPLSNPHQIRAGYIAMSLSDVEYVAEFMGTTSHKLLKMLKKSNLLRLTDSCDGYQSKVSSRRDENGRITYQWAYCLYDMEYATKKLINQTEGGTL